MTRTIMAFPIVVVLLLAPPIANADVVSDWNGIMVTTVSSQNPFAQARFAAITQLALFEAVNAITGGYHPYLGVLLPVLAPRDSDSRGRHRWQQANRSGSRVHAPSGNSVIPEL